MYEAQKRRKSSGLPNQDPYGVAFGVVAFNSLQPWAYDDLWHGDQARDLSYEAAIEEIQAEAKREFDDLLEQAEIAAAEVDAHMSDAEKERFIESYFTEREARTDRDEFVEERVERRREDIDISEPIIEGVYDGVTYRITWLRGAPLLLVFDGPQGVCVSRCNPCVPGAADLDSGFLLAHEMEPEKDYSHWVGCHCVPRSWMAEA